MGDALVYIGAGTLGVTVVAYVVKLTFQVTRIEKEQQQYTESQVDNMRRDMTSIDRDLTSRTETLRRETGEMGAALRTKIHEIETWNRDTFVRKDTFEQVVTRIERSVEKLGDKLGEKIDKLLAGS